MTPGLTRSVAFTLGALFVYRLGNFIPPRGLYRSPGRRLRQDNHDGSLALGYGTACLAAMFLFPEALIAYAKITYHFGGAAALIVVCAVLHVESQVCGTSLTGRGGDYS